MLQDELKKTIETLAVKIGERNLEHPEKLTEAAHFIIHEWAAQGYSLQKQSYKAGSRFVSNLSIQLPGTTPEDVVIGAHYDSVSGSPGANDNASGVAALLALSRRLQGKSFKRTIRFVAFVNEEPPYFQTDQMGSRVYAATLKEKKIDVTAMISLETIGYYSETPGSQQYPPLLKYFYPSTGNFVGVVGNLSSRSLVKTITRTLKEAEVAVESGSLPEWITGVGFSDHESFWKQGYPAVMITDTALYRYPYYHTALDLPDKVNYPKLEKLVLGMEKVLGTLAN